MALLSASVDPAGGPVHAVLDAGRREYYCGVYASATCLREALVTGEELHVAAADAAVFVVCEAKVGESLAVLQPMVVREPVAADALTFAVEIVKAGAFDDAATLDANYLRRIDMEIQNKLAAGSR